MSSEVIIKKGPNGSQKAAALFISILNLAGIFLCFILYGQMKDRWFLSDAEKLIKTLAPILGIYCIVMGIIWLLRFLAYNSQSICVCNDSISGTGLKTPPFASESFSILPADVTDVSVKNKVLKIEAKGKTVTCAVAEPDQVADTIRRLCGR